MAAGPASHPTMLSVHILPSHHDLLMDRPEASAARDSGVREMLVIIDGGSIIAAHTPPVDSPNGVFRTDDRWIINEIRRAYELGIQHGDQRAVVGVPDPPTSPTLAPTGWVLWRDLRPGDIATSGGNAGWVAICEDEAWKFEHNGGLNALRFDIRWPEAEVFNSRFNFTPTPARAPQWPFYRVVRRGVAGEVLEAAIQAVLDRDPQVETVESVLDRVLPAQVAS